MQLAWWQSGIVYQVYPRSFQDSTGDGVGDIRGIIARLDHLVWLGVDALWVSPMYPSPMADFGYDVSDYCNIDGLFGTLADFDALRARTRALGLRLILDFVPNHTSDRHPWFVASRSSRDDARRDWYLWHDAAPDGGPPNNWRSNFGGTGWTWDAGSGQYYYHSFLPQQPDLNWRNPAVRAAMLDVLRFWLDRGVDGFRVDVMWMMIKDDRFRDNPPDGHGGLLPLYTANRPEVHAVVAEMRAVLDGYGERLLIGELWLPIPQLVSYYGTRGDGAQLPFNFQLILAAWQASVIAGIITDYEAALPAGGWPNWVLGNHDRSRIATRVGPAQARVAAMLLLTLRGTPTIYNGEEIGMVDVAIPPDEIQDPAEKRQPGQGEGRDPERTPMPWDGSPGAGFTTGRPWLRLGPDHAERNVAVLAKDPGSILSLYRDLVALRRGYRVLVEGRVEVVSAVDDVLSYQRRDGGSAMVVLLNFGGAARRVAVGAGRMLLSTDPQRGLGVVGGDFELRPDEGVIVALAAVG